MARYSGRYHKGASKDTKAEKRAEAEARAALRAFDKAAGPLLAA